MVVDELSVLEPLPPDANGAGGEQNHLIPLEIKLLHLLAEGSEPAHGQSAILPGDNSSADLITT